MLLRTALGATLVATLLSPCPALAPAAQGPPVPTPQERPQAPPLPEDGEAPVTTGSGLVYSVLRAGTPDGPRPAVGDMVEVHYTGWLEDGTVFDNSRVERGPGLGIEPARFRVGRVIEGWNEALELMTPGARFKLTIPPALGYGDNARNQIPANATLTFDVELLSVESGPELPAYRPIGEGARTLDNGLRIEVLEPSSRPAPEGSQVVKFDWIFWTPDGTVLDCSDWAGSPIRCTAAAPPGPLAFLTEAMPNLGDGATVLLEVPPALFGEGNLPGVGDGEPTLWRVETLYVAYPPELPPFRRVAADATVLAESGARVETLSPGVGEPVGATQQVELGFTYWDGDGELIDSTLNPGRGAIPTTAEQLRIPFMQDLVPTLAVGAVCLVEVSASDAFGSDLPPGLTADETVVWQLEIVSRVDPLPVPAFRLPDPAKSVTTSSGLVIETLRAGSGPNPRRDQRARVHYAGWLASDGTPFDNSFERGLPSEFGLTDVIDGWTETLERMQVGEQVLVRIPWDLAYGNSGRAPKIPPQADLVFLVDLIALEE